MFFIRRHPRNIAAYNEKSQDWNEPTKAYTYRKLCPWMKLRICWYWLPWPHNSIKLVLLRCAVKHVRRTYLWILRICMSWDGILINLEHYFYYVSCFFSHVIRIFVQLFLFVLFRKINKALVTPISFPIWLNNHVVTYTDDDLIKSKTVCIKTWVFSINIWEKQK